MIRIMCFSSVHYLGRRVSIVLIPAYRVSLLALYETRPTRYPSHADCNGRRQLKRCEMKGLDK
jgi:hypothetical protein